MESGGLRDKMGKFISMLSSMDGFGGNLQSEYGRQRAVKIIATHLESQATNNALSASLYRTASSAVTSLVVGVSAPTDLPWGAASG